MGTPRADIHPHPLNALYVHVVKCIHVATAIATAAWTPVRTLLFDTPASERAFRHVVASFGSEAQATRESTRGSSEVLSRRLDSSLNASISLCSSAGLDSPWGSMGEIFHKMSRNRSERIAMVTICHRCCALRRLSLPRGGLLFREKHKDSRLESLCCTLRNESCLAYYAESVPLRLFSRQPSYQVHRHNKYYRTHCTRAN